MSFFKKLAQTKAEEFPKEVQFTKRDFCVLLFIPLIFLNGWIVTQVLNLSTTNSALVDTLFRGLLFLIILLVYKNMFVQHWKKFNLAKLQSWVLVIVGGILLQIVITSTRFFLPDTPSTIEGSAQEIGLDTVNFKLLIISLGPFFTSLIEDTVFKYTLLHKLFIPHNLVRIIVFTVNPILFGLIHYHNFGGNLIGTVSFMTAGLFLNLVYLWTKNIWHTLLIHAINNLILGFLGMLVLWAVKLITGQ